jgi:hypothetical protein
MSYGDDIAASNGFEPGDEDDEFGSADFDEDEADFDPDDDGDWDDDDEAAGSWDKATRSL